MIDKKPLDPNRIRKITGSFAFIEHRFMLLITDFGEHPVYLLKSE